MQVVSLLLWFCVELKRRFGLGGINAEKQKLHNIQTDILIPSEGLPKVKLSFEPFVLRSLFIAQSPSSFDWTLEDNGKDLSQLSL